MRLAKDSALVRRHGGGGLPCIHDGVDAINRDYSAGAHDDIENLTCNATQEVSSGLLPRIFAQ